MHPDMYSALNHHEPFSHELKYVRFNLESLIFGIGSIVYVWMVVQGSKQIEMGYRSYNMLSLKPMWRYLSMVCKWWTGMKFRVVNGSIDNMPWAKCTTYTMHLTATMDRQNYMHHAFTRHNGSIKCLMEKDTHSAFNHHSQSWIQICPILIRSLIVGIERIVYAGTVVQGSKKMEMSYR
jgi:hypothetical protein